MSSPASFASPAGRFLTAILLLLSLTLGGGGSPAPLLELALQSVVALVVMAWLFTAAAPWRQVPRQAWLIAALVAVIPLVQLLPLPPVWWQALPGREGEVAALELIGQEHTWRALTLSPARTLASLLAALAALPCLLLTASLDPRGRWQLLGVIALTGLATLVIGAGQMSGGSGNPLRFFDPEQSFLTGFQANHNSTADVVLIAMLALAAIASHLRERHRLNLTGLQFTAGLVVLDGVMALGLVLTGSRAGVILLPVVLLVQFLILQPGPKVRWGWLAISAGAAALTLTLAAALLRGNRAVEAVLARFTLEGEFRPELWRDSLYALGQYWPAGSGQGTFAPVMMAVERLEVVDQTLPHRAHNDYLELAIGAGLPGVAVLTTLAGLVLLALLRARRAPPAGSRAQVLFASGTLAVIALHSLVDYPLRSMALAALAATAIGLLLPAGTAQSEQSEGSRR